MSYCLGLANNVSSCTLCTMFAFKLLMDNKIPAWHLAQRMGHTSSNKDLQHLTYAPTQGPVNTRRKAADNDSVAAFSEGVQAAMKTNSLVMHLPDPTNVDPDTLKGA